MNLDEMIEKVNSKRSFLDFVAALSKDAEQADVEPQISCEGTMNLSPGGWESGTISDFLSSMVACVEDNDRIGTSFVLEEPSWKSFACMLYAGKYYE